MHSNNENKNFNKKHKLSKSSRKHVYKYIAQSGKFQSTMEEVARAFTMFFSLFRSEQIIKMFPPKDFQGRRNKGEPLLSYFLHKIVCFTIV